MSKYKEKEIVTCLVTGIESYGIFVKVDEEYSGLIHISEISIDFVKDVHDYVVLNQKIEAKVIEVDEEHKKLKLSLKQLGALKKSPYDESEKGFQPLKDKFEYWVDEKLSDYEK